MKKEIKRGYKVVVEKVRTKYIWGLDNGQKIILSTKACGSKMVSFAIMSQSVDYKFDKWSKRPKGCGPLSVFFDENTAKRFARMNGGKACKVYECEYIQSNDVGFWKVGDNPDGRFYGFPLGTNFADKVRLIRPI